MTTKHIVRATLMAMAAVVVMGFAGAASAAGFKWEDVINAAGKNGMVTMEQATAYSEREEQFAGFAPWMSEHMKDLDMNHDGMVSMDEMHTYMAERHMTNDDLYKAWYRHMQ